MKHLFVPYEQSLTLKELGFDGPCIKGFYNKEPIYTTVTTPVDFNNRKQLGELVSTPTFSQAFKFFRDKYNLHYSIHKRNTNTNQTLYSFGGFMGDYFTYEEAELACLIKLIEIVKEK